MYCAGFYSNTTRLPVPRSNLARYIDARLCHAETTVFRRAHRSGPIKSAVSEFCAQAHERLAQLIPPLTIRTTSPKRIYLLAI